MRIKALASRSSLSLLLFAVFGGLSSSIHAQSSVTLYGVLDEGLNFTSNIAGNRAVELTSGYASGSRWGMRGVEDLGGGTKAVFQLENGLNLSNGNAGQAGCMFGRQAYAGLQNERFGMLTVGRQYDSVVDYLAPTTANGNWGGYLFAHPFDNDNTDNSFRVNNAVKYASPSIGGVRFGGLYGFSNASGFADNRLYSIGASYSNGGLLAGAAYLRADRAGIGGAGVLADNDASFVARRMQVFGAGIDYTFGPATAGFVYTNSSYADPVANGYIGMNRSFGNGSVLKNVKYQNFEINGKYQFTPAYAGVFRGRAIHVFDRDLRRRFGHRQAAHPLGGPDGRLLRLETHRRLRADRPAEDRQRLDRLGARRRLRVGRERAFVERSSVRRARRAAARVLTRLPISVFSFSTRVGAPALPRARVDRCAPDLTPDRQDFPARAEASKIPQTLALRLS